MSDSNMNNDFEEPKVAFEKWHDPWGRDAEESLDDHFDDFDDNEEEEEEEEETEDGYVSYKDKESPQEKLLKKMMKHEKRERQREEPAPVKSIITPMGVVPMDEHSAPGKVWNFWTGHTNFPLTQKMVTGLSKILGVETLDVFTPYRMRVGVGKLFVPAKVMNRITTYLKAQFPEKAASSE